MVITRKSRIDAGIDMTPLIDVVFQLLIFLMVSSQFIKPDHRVELPIGPLASAAVSQDDESLTLTILPDNSLLLEDSPVTLENLGSSLHDIIAHTEITALEIRADRISDVGIFITVIETATENGITNLGYQKKGNDEE
ncbi:biopolymer transporter ExbD [Akkermansiaceae bacterium]|nr:biopolymer transporter ExbD [Akkermansiaceae bacterium]MDB4492135.1 biopolymer transporter ExbD [bacterium]MDB4615067.1 biopolymer transporter ExbD [Akkermansiaceae bacterium]MDB4667279.1 biopolymer transporter ExbD [Akkermansiaceae bacterium]MDB4820297.1 biopolymer transporter ExbD [Akkermansiaceae bacterium]